MNLIISLLGATALVFAIVFVTLIGVQGIVPALSHTFGIPPLVVESACGLLIALLTIQIFSSLKEDR